MMGKITIDKHGRFDGDKVALIAISNKSTFKEVSFQIENPLCG